MSGNTVEHVKDAAPIMGKYFDILCIRTFPSLRIRGRLQRALYQAIHKIFRHPCGEPGERDPASFTEPYDVITISEAMEAGQRKSDRRPSQRGANGSAGWPAAGGRRSC